MKLLAQSPWLFHIFAKSSTTNSRNFECSDRITSGNSLLMRKSLADWWVNIFVQHMTRTNQINSSMRQLLFKFTHYQEHACCLFESGFHVASEDNDQVNCNSLMITKIKPHNCIHHFWDACPGLAFLQQQIFLRQKLRLQW